MGLRFYGHVVVQMAGSAAVSNDATLTKSYNKGEAGAESNKGESSGDDNESDCEVRDSFMISSEDASAAGSNDATLVSFES